MILVTTATTGSGVLFSRRCPFLERGRETLAYFHPFWLFCHKSTHFLVPLFTVLNSMPVYKNWQISGMLTVHFLKSRCIGTHIPWDQETRGPYNRCSITIIPSKWMTTKIQYEVYRACITFDQMRDFVVSSFLEWCCSSLCRQIRMRRRSSVQLSSGQRYLLF